MSEKFLGKFLRIAKEITGAERGMAVDTELSLLDSVNLTKAVIESPNFSQIASSCLRQAITSQQCIITNNVITDPSKAPTTNTGFADLRVVVAIPVVGQGAIYLDQQIRQGIIPRDMLNKLMRLGNQVLEEGLEASSEADLIEWYHRLN